MDLKNGPQLVMLGSCDRADRLDRAVVATHDTLGYLSALVHQFFCRPKPLSLSRLGLPGQLLRDHAWRKSWPLACLNVIETCRRPSRFFALSFFFCDFKLGHRPQVRSNFGLF